MRFVFQSCGRMSPKSEAGIFSHHHIGNSQAGAPALLCKFEYIERRATVTYLRTAGWVIMVATVPPYDHASMTPRSIIKCLTVAEGCSRLFAVPLLVSVFDVSAPPLSRTSCRFFWRTCLLYRPPGFSSHSQRKNIS